MGIVRFKEYISLLEVQFSTHYMERTSNKGEPKFYKSRIVMFDPDTHMEGFDIDHFVMDGEKIDITEVEDITGFTEDDIYSIVERALRKITRDPFLKKWEPTSGKDYVVIKMGKIYLHRDDEYTIKVVLKGGNSKNGKLIGFFTPGDTVWGFVRKIKGKTDDNNGSDKKMATLKYYDDTESARMRIESDVKQDSVGSGVPFSGNFSFEYPYGNDPKIMIDLERGIFKFYN